MQGSFTAAATKYQGAHACYLSDVCGHSKTVYQQAHSINEYTVPCCRCNTRWMYTVLKRNQIRHDLILQFFVLRMSILTLKFKFVPVIKNAVLFYMLGIDYIKPICFFCIFLRIFSLNYNKTQVVNQKYVLVYILKVMLFQITWSGINQSGCFSSQKLAFNNNEQIQMLK